MIKEIADEWVKELRSGNWQQGREFLNRDNRLCCLAVLCEIGIKHGVEVIKKQCKDRISYNATTIALPEQIMKWSEVKTYCGILPLPHPSKQLCQENLSDMNDRGLDFDAIADAIEKHWEAL